MVRSIPGPKEEGQACCSGCGRCGRAVNHTGSDWQPYRPIHRFPFSEELANEILLTCHPCVVLQTSHPTCALIPRCLTPMKNPNRIPAAPNAHPCLFVQTRGLPMYRACQSCRSKASGGASWLPACPGLEVARTTNCRRTCAHTHGSTPAPPRGEDYSR